MSVDDRNWARPVVYKVRRRCSIHGVAHQPGDVLTDDVASTLNLNRLVSSGVLTVVLDPYFRRGYDEGVQPMPVTVPPGKRPRALATQATAGTPGSFGSGRVPSNLGEMTGVTAVPANAWSPTERVVLGDGSKARWTGTAWAAWITPLASIAVTPATATLATTTGTQQLAAAPVPADAPLGTVAWTSSDPTKATVGGSTGLVTGVAAGTVTITAASGSARGTATITVPAAAPAPAPPPDQLSDGPGSSEDVVVEVSKDPETASKKRRSRSSADSVVPVQEGPAE
jgi:hypothetical protein